MNTQKKDQVAKRSTTMGLKSITMPTLAEPNKYFGNQLWKQLQCIPENKEAVDLIQWFSKPKDLADTVLIFPELFREGVTETVKEGVPCFSVPIQKGDNLSKLFGSDWRNIYNHAINKTFREAFPNPDRIDVQFPNEAPAIIYVPLKRTLPELPESAEGEACREVELKVPTVHQGTTGKKKIIRVQPTIDNSKPKPKQTSSTTKSFSYSIISIPLKLKGPCSQFKAKAELKVSGTQYGNQLTFETGGNSVTTKLAHNGNEIAIQLDNNGVSIFLSSTGTKLIQFDSFIFTVEQKTVLSEMKVLLILNGEKIWQDNEKGLLIKLSLTLEIEMLSAESLALLEECGFHLPKAQEIVAVVNNDQRLKVLEPEIKKLAQPDNENNLFKIVVSLVAIVITVIVFVRSMGKINLWKATPIARKVIPIAKKVASNASKAAAATASAAADPASKAQNEENKVASNASKAAAATTYKAAAAPASKAQNEENNEPLISIPLCVILEDITLPGKLNKNTIQVICEKCHICLKYDEDNESKP